MAYSRIFGILDQELTQHLAFSFSIDEHFTRPGSTTILPKDHFRFTVWATNNSAIPLRSLRGSIAPTTLASFDSASFSLGHLRPKKSRQLASIEAKIVRRPSNGCLSFNQIGMVNVSISADLSRFRIEKSRPLSYCKVI